MNSPPKALFEKPSRETKAIPIIQPDDHQQKSPLPSFLPPLHEAAIQHATDAVSSLGLSRPARLTGNGAGPHPSSAGSAGERLKPTGGMSEYPAEYPAGGHPAGGHPAGGHPAGGHSVEGTDEDNFAFNIYARPFIPKAFTVINTLSGKTVSTLPSKGLNFDAYINGSLGPAAGFLPSPLQIRPPASFTDINSINPESYEEFFQFHLNCEIQAQRDENESYSLYGHKVTVKGIEAARSLSQGPGEAVCLLRVPGLREDSPFVEEEDIIRLRQLRYRRDGSLLGWTNVIYDARVLSVSRADEVLVLRVSGLAGDLLDRIDKFNVQFPLPDERHLPLLYALPVAQQAHSRRNWLYSMLFPTHQDSEIQEKLHPGVFCQKFLDREINWEQKKAVESIWSRNYGNLPFLISGPPGTGKTKTIIETTLQLVRNSTGYSHVLLCAPSDPAADTLAQRLAAALEPGEMLRLNRTCRTFAEVPGTLLPYCYIVNDTFTLPSFPVLMTYRVVVTTCRDASMLTRARMTNADLYATEKAMQGIATSIHPLDRPPQEVKLHWSALLIDEAAQATEPEALIPLTVVAPSQKSPILPEPLVVMAGDEHQLGPRTSLPSSPLKTSLFARLFRRPVYADHPLARGKRGEEPPPLTQSLLPIYRPAFANLFRNYRSHPAILAVPSNLFYADTLQPEAKNTDRLAGWGGWRGRGWPVLLHDNRSTDDLELPGLIEGTGGWYNAGEADIACQYAASLVASGLIEQKEVCIMSPFKAQVRYLRQRLRQPQYGGLWGVNIGPTEAFQGLEKGVVILCVTRSRKQFVRQDQRLGWGIIGMPNKMNVALTRSKYGLIVVGRRELLVEEDPNWKAFVVFCERNHLVVGDPAIDGEAGHNHQGAPKQVEQLTRLERVLVDRERSDSQHRVWGMDHGAEADEMWAQGAGMMETPDIEEEDD